ncbi:hypothetical protein GPROT2_00447 [Gammaproteobacteria bacterium]|nr:hypothetical protein GPROT2_00447 [Gammaproteobacteria bacterium]
MKRLIHLLIVGIVMCFCLSGAHAGDSQVTVKLESPPLPPVVGDWGYTNFSNCVAGGYLDSESDWVQCFIADYNATPNNPCPGITMVPDGGWVD